MSDINIDKIKNTLQIILDKSHTVPEKRIMRVKNYGMRPVIEMACPICGDSAKSMQRKRGNLFLNNMFYVCFNCGYKMSYVKFLERFGVDIDMDDKLAIYDHIDKYSKFNNVRSDYDLSRMDKIMNLDEVIKTYNNRKDDLYYIEPITSDSNVYKYLKHRKIHNTKDIYQGVFKVTDRWIEQVMVILNRYDDNLLGFQIRNLKDDKKKRIYKIYDFQSIYNYVNEKDISDDDALPYNKLSHLYNILNVDFYNKITIFEGYLDSTFFPNSIGSTGVDTDYTFLEEQDIEIRFFYDNDRVGNRKSLSKLKSGYSVFLWNKLFDTISKGDQKKKYMLQNNIKDLNDLVKASKENVVEKYNLEQYFSVDEFDKLYL